MTAPSRKPQEFRKRLKGKPADRARLDAVLTVTRR